MVEGVLQIRLSVQGNVFSASLGLHPCRPQRSDLLTLAKLRKLLNLQAPKVKLNLQALIILDDTKDVQPDASPAVRR